MDRKSGFILPLTIIIVFAISTLMIRLLTRATALAPVQRMVFDREQAKQIALMGVTLVQAQLTGPFKSEKDKQTWYKEFFKNLNQWQTFTLKQKADGIDATIQLYMSCEQGKIPLNALWDFKEKKWIAVDKLDVKKLLANLILSRSGNQEKVLEPLEAALKKFDKPVEDLTALFVHDYFKGLAPEFYPLPASAEQGGEKPKKELNFADVFTVGTSELTLQPPFLSAGVQAAFDLKKVSEEKKIEDAMKKVIEGLKDSLEWKTAWDQLMFPLYGKKYESLPQPLTKLFSSTVGASEISVVSYGKVGNVTQKLLVLLNQNLESDGRVTYAIKKLYWL